MRQLRLSHERGHSNFGWLDSYHTFSFGEYHDPAHINFASLRVINEDRVQPGAGFAPHGHRDMEIITYVLEGALEHKDSLGNGSVIQAGDVQRMSAGTGVRHSEYNASANASVHFLQIWIIPSATGLPPSYEQRHYAPPELDGRLRLIASPDGADGSVTVHQDARLYATRLNKDAEVRHQLEHGRRAYAHVARGMATINGQSLSAGDAVAMVDEHDIVLHAKKSAEILLFDLA